MRRPTRAAALLLGAVAVVLGVSCRQKEVEINYPISVPYAVQDIVFTQNSGCIDTLGAVTAKAYVYANFAGKADDVDGQSPDPIKIISQPSKVADKYVFDLPADEDLMYIRSERRISSAVNLTRLNL